MTVLRRFLAKFPTWHNSELFQRSSEKELANKEFKPHTILADIGFLLRTRPILYLHFAPLPCYRKDVGHCLGEMHFNRRKSPPWLIEH